MDKKISMADFNTILLHVEKISNGQLDFIGVLRGELKNLLNIDNADPLIDSIKTADTDLINQARLFLANFDFTIEDTDANYRLVKFGDTYCELEPITTTDSETSSAVIPTDGSNLPTPAPTLQQRIVKIQFHLQNMGQSAIIIGQELIECKKEVGHGEWYNWLEKNFKLSEKMANNFMRLANRFGNRNLNSDLSQTQLIALLALPEGEEEKFIEEKAAEGTPVENMTVKQLHAEIKKWKNESEKLQKELAETDKLQRHYQSLYSAESKHARENACKVTDLQMEKSKLQAEITNLKNQPPQVIERTETIIPPDYVATKKAAADLQADVVALKKSNSDLLRRADSENSRAQQLAIDKHALQLQIEDLQQQLHNQKPVEVVPADYDDNKKKLDSLQAQISELQKQLASRTLEVVPPADYDENKKELEGAKLKIAELQAAQTNKNLNLPLLAITISSLENLSSAASDFLRSPLEIDALKFLYQYNQSNLDADISKIEKVLNILKAFKKDNSTDAPEGNNFDDAVGYLFNGDAED